MRHTRRAILALASTTALLLAAACGSPDDDSGAREFVYTPVAYVITPGPNGTPWAIAETASGGRYVADEVLVSVAYGSVDAILEFAEDYGFTTSSRFRDDRRGYERFLVRVPPGSAIAARKLFRAQGGVVDADLNVIRSGL